MDPMEPSCQHLLARSTPHAALAVHWHSHCDHTLQAPSSQADADGDSLRTEHLSARTAYR